MAGNELRFRKVGATLDLSLSALKRMSIELARDPLLIQGAGGGAFQRRDASSGTQAVIA